MWLNNRISRYYIFLCNTTVIINDPTTNVFFSVSRVIKLYPLLIFRFNKKFIYYDFVFGKYKRR